MIKKHPVISTLVVVLVVAGLFFVFRPSSQATTAVNKPAKAAENSNNKEEKKLPVEVSVAKNGPIGSSILTTATLDPDAQVTIVSETNGIIEKIPVDEGDYVKEGQLLVELQDREKTVKLQQTNIRVDNAKQELDRKEASYHAKIISESDYQKAKYEMDVAVAEKNAAQVDLDRTIIRAPFSGIITQRMIEKGQNINAQTQLLTLVDADPLEAKIYLPEKEIHGIRTNQTVQLALNSRKDVNFTGRVKQINPAVDTRTGTVKVTVEVTKAPSQVRPGSFVDVKLETARHDNATLIPKKALMEEAGERFVYVIQKDKASRRIVSTGFVDDFNVEILSGVSAGEKVVTSGQGSLREGTRTEIIAQK